jgi:hypothetical protein
VEKELPMGFSKVNVPGKGIGEKSSCFLREK